MSKKIRTNKPIKHIYADLEFTGLNRKGELISIALITEDNEKFYAEANDYDPNLLSDWIYDNIFKNLLFNEESNIKNKNINKKLFTMKGSCEDISKEIKDFLYKYSENGKYQIVFIMDAPQYDWLYITELVAEFNNGYPVFPEYVFYLPMDVTTMFYLLGIDPDINREKFLGIEDDSSKHNSLYDTVVVRKIYKVLSKSISTEK